MTSLSTAKLLLSLQPKLKFVIMIYFIGIKGFNYVKIGVTKNLKTRLEHLNNASPFELEVLLTIDGNIIGEQHLHNRFKQYKHKNEWFILSEEILSFIANPVITSNIIDNHTNKVELDINYLIELYKEGKSNIEISEIMNVSIHVVRRRIKTLKLALQYRNYVHSKPKGYYVGKYQQRKDRNNGV